MIRWVMFRMRSFVHSALVFALLLLQTGCRNERTHVPALPGNPAPPFSLRDESGKIVSLSDFSGKVVVLDFWATWCGPCKDAVAELEALHRKYTGRGVVILGISVNKESDAPARVRTFARQHALTYPLVIDDGSAYKAYGVTRIPATYILDRGLIIRDTFPGFRPGIGADITRKIAQLLASPPVPPPRSLLRNETGNTLST